MRLCFKNLFMKNMSSSFNCVFDHQTLKILCSRSWTTHILIVLCYHLLSKEKKDISLQFLVLMQNDIV